MKDLVVTSIDRFGWNEMKTWAISLRKSGYDGDALAIVYRHADLKLVEEAKKYNIDLILADTDWNGHPINHAEQPRHPSMVCRNRFFHMWWYLQDKTDKYRWVISTDVRDVVFQSNPSDFLHSYDLLRVSNFPSILASSEGQTYGKEPWNAEDQRNSFGPVVWDLTMKDRKVVNAGVMTVDGEHAADVFLNIYFTSKHYPGAAADQAAYNLLTATSLKGATTVLDHSQGWACQCGTVLDTSKPYHLNTFEEPVPTYTPDGLFVTQEGRPFVIVHQYDRVAGMKEIIEKRYS